MKPTINQINYRFCGLIAVAALLQTSIILKLDAAGIIDKIIPWDECVFLFVGIRNAYNILHNPFSMDMLRNIEMVHSPLGYLQTTIGALVSDFSPAVPYVFNFFYLALLLVTLAQRLRESSLASLVAIVLVFITTPYIFIFTSYIKPDFLAGTLFFILLTLLFENEPRSFYTKSDMLRESLLSILILCAKPIACYMPAVLIGTFVAAGLRDVMYPKNNANIKAAKKHYGLLIAVAFATFAVVFILNIDAFIAYFQAVMSNTVIRNDITLWQRLTFYMADRDDTHLWGHNPVVFALIITLFIYKICANREKSHTVTLLILLGIAAVNYIPITFFAYPDKPYGAVFAACCMFIFFYAFTHLQSNHRKVLVLNVLIIAFCVYHFALPVRTYASYMNATKEKVLRADALVDQFSREIIKDSHSDPHAISIYSSLVGPIPIFNFGIKIYSLANILPTSIHDEINFNEDFIRNHLNQYNYIIMIDPPTVMNDELPVYYESFVRRKELQEIIFSSWNLLKLSKAEYNGVTYHLYRRLSAK